jgi:uncharacterized SAM-binding protein YcdF (DUF218 family)
VSGLAARLGSSSGGRPAPRAQVGRRAAGAADGGYRRRGLGRFPLGLLLALLALPGLVLGIGFLVEGRQPPLRRSDAIVVISGDEDLARFRAGLRLWREEWAPRLMFSGAAREGPISNAEAMRRLALGEGVPPEAILLEEQGADTYGNALHTRDLMEAHGLRSAILVTSPYHLQRAALTFGRVYQGSGIDLIANAAPDSDWRKRSWWLRSDLRLLTLSELEKLGYILLTGRYN